MRRNKYNVSSPEARTIDGIRFDSKAESNRYCALKLMQMGGVISKLEIQPVYVLTPAFVDKLGHKHQGISYRADFRYKDSSGQVIVEDVKGALTEVYRIKKKLLLWRYPDINFVEIHP